MHAVEASHVGLDGGDSSLLGTRESKRKFLEKSPEELTRWVLRGPAWTAGLVPADGDQGLEAKELT